MQASTLSRALGATLFLCALSSLSAAANESGLAGQPTWSTIAPGADFYAVSATTRALVQSDPLVLELPALPPDAQLVEVFVSWNWLMTGPAPATDTLTINGANVVGLLAGQGIPDLGWGKARGVSYLASGFADELQFGAANIVQGAVDKALGPDPAAFGAGLSLVVVYKTTFGLQQRVDLWAGYSSTESSASGLAQATLQLPVAYLGGTAHLYLNALDGLDFTGPNDELLLNGVSVGGLLDGTGDLDDAWKGLAGPHVGSNLYDALDDSIADVLEIGDDEIRARTNSDLGSFLTDSIGHTLAVFAALDQCGTTTTYCTAKVNSLGCTPSISGSGTPSVDPTQGAFEVRVNELISHMNGLLFYGQVPNAAPFQGGLLCIGGTVTRTGLQNSGGTGTQPNCTGKMSFDFNAYLASGADPALSAGSMVFAQYWTRDVNDLFGSSLSDALAFDLCP
jgi:hypothetical protein